MGTQAAFTALNLLNRVLSVASLVVTEVNRVWFVEWEEELQALLVGQLTSPYVEIRDLVIVVMEQLDELLSGNNVDMTVTSLLAEFETEISRRALRLWSTDGARIRKSGIMCFKDAGRSSSLLLYVRFLAELVQVSVRSGMARVLKHLSALELWRIIGIPVGPKDKGEMSTTILWRNLLRITVTSKSCPLYKVTVRSLSGCPHRRSSLIESEGLMVDYKVACGRLMLWRSMAATDHRS